MLQYSVDAYVAWNVATGFPIMCSLMTWSVWYITRAFRNSEEWGWALAAGGGRRRDRRGHRSRTRLTAPHYGLRHGMGLLH
jgi:hypothetical protein